MGRCNYLLTIIKMNKNYCAIIVVYLITWFPLLLNYDGVYWDDWTLVSQKNGELISVFDQAGSLFSGHLHTFLQSIGNGVFPYRLLTFFSYLIISLSIYYLAKPKGICGKSNAVYLAIFVAIFPVNTTRTAMICFSSFYVALFFIAFVLLVYKRESVKYRIISLLLFFISFEIQSLLVFYLLPISYLIFIGRYDIIKDKKIVSVLKGVKVFFLKNIVCLLLPFSHFIIKNTFFVPYGPFENYNTINIPWQEIPFWPYYSYLSSFYKPMTASFGFLSITNVVFIAILGAICSVLFNIKEKHPSLKREIIFIAIGCILFIVAIFPYYAVGKTGIGEWQSRFQVLIPLGASIVLLYGIKIVFNKNIIYFISSSCIVLFALFHLNNLKDFQIDSFKQDAIMLQMKSINEVKNTQDEIILFNDKALDYNALGRSYRFYEWNGMMKKVYGDQVRFGMTENLYKHAKSWLKYTQYQNYNFYDYKGDGQKIAGTIHVKKTTHLFTFKAMVKLFYLKVFNHKQYETTIIKYINVYFEALN